MSNLGEPLRSPDTIRDLVYGANEGVITTFAVVARVTGGSLASLAVLVVGTANLAADPQHPSALSSTATPMVWLSICRFRRTSARALESCVGIAYVIVVGREARPPLGQ